MQAKLADTERKRMKDEHAFITKANFMAMIMSIVQILVEEAGREIAVRVSQRFSTLFAAAPEVQTQARSILSQHIGKPLPLLEDEEREEE